MDLLALSRLRCVQCLVSILGVEERCVNSGGVDEEGEMWRISALVPKFIVDVPSLFIVWLSAY